MAPLTVAALAAPAPLTASHQVRFTAEQDRLLRQLTRYSRRPISATIRDVVVCWAANAVNEVAGLTGAEQPIDVHRLVDELNALAELEAEPVES